MIIAFYNLALNTLNDLITNVHILYIWLTTDTYD